MSSLKKLERDRTTAELASIESLLAGLTQEDVMARLGLEDRRDELQAQLAAVQVEFEDGLASAALFFGGRPVAGQRGVESEFAGYAVARYQDLVAKLLVQELGDLGQRGPVPNKSASTMHITNIVRGSFGFLMEELQPQGQLVDTALSVAVDHASRLMAAFTSDDEAEFQSVAGEVDGRILATAGEFFGFLGENQATLRLVTGEHDNAFNSVSVQLAIARAATTTVVEVAEEVQGQLYGALPDGHYFEFRNLMGTIIRGRVDKGIPADHLMQWNLTLLNIETTARIKVRRVYKDGALVRESYTLLGLDVRGPLQLQEQRL